LKSEIALVLLKGRIAIPGSRLSKEGMGARVIQAEQTLKAFLPVWRFQGILEKPFELSKIGGMHVGKVFLGVRFCSSGLWAHGSDPRVVGGLL